MTINAEKYRFSDFTHLQYSVLIDTLIDRGYAFKGFADDLETAVPWVLWRHDLDFSPHRSLKLARIEADKGVKSTFFLLMHSRFYNLFEKECFEIIKNIQALGHEIGLHYDHGFYGQQMLEQLEATIRLEAQFLEQLFDQPIQTFSFHNPNEWALNLGHETLGGLINTYSDFFKNQVAYASDSNGYWRNISILDRIEERPQKLQVLTHPVWWTEKVTSPKERVWTAIEGRAEKNKEMQLAHWNSWGRELIDW